ncbi:MAG: 50S ribosomal protein L24 [Patescibacteria group bacterium]
MKKVKKFKKGDQVIVVKGKDKGKTGIILKVIPPVHRVVVEGVNVMKKHVRPTKKNLQGGIIDYNMHIPTANIRIVCPNTQKPSRVGFKINRAGNKERIAKKTGTNLDQASN